MKVSVEVKGLEDLSSKLNKLANNLTVRTFDALTTTLEEARGQATKQKANITEDKFKIQLKRGSKGAYGKLITNMPLNNSYGTYSAKSYAPMLEFGTGKKGELEKLGQTYYFHKSGYSWWLLPVDKAGKQLPNEVIYSKQTDTFYYLMFAQSPRPFMRPTAFWLENEGIENFKEELKKGIRNDVK